jgi:hypothetical protein
MADKPIALEIVQVSMPAQFPNADENAALLPPSMDCRKTIATPCPGTMTSSKVVSANAGITASRALTVASVVYRADLRKFNAWIAFHPLG